MKNKDFKYARQKANMQFGLMCGIALGSLFVRLSIIQTFLDSNWIIAPIGALTLAIFAYSYYGAKLDEIKEEENKCLSSPSQ